MADYIKDELNVAEISFDDQMQDWCSLSASPNNKVLGRKLGKQFKQVLKEVKSLDHDAVSAAQASGSVALPCGVEVAAEHLVVELNVKCDVSKYGAEIGMSGKMFIALDLTQDRASLSHRLARELTSRVQKLRKSAGLKLEDEVEVFIANEAPSGTPSADFVAEAVKSHAAEISMKLSGGQIVDAQHLSPHAVVIAEDSFKLTNPEVAGDAAVPSTLQLRLVIAAPAVTANRPKLLEACSGNEELARHAEHTLAMFTFANMQARKEVPLKLMLNSKSPVVEFVAVRGEHYFVGQKERV